VQPAITAPMAAMPVTFMKSRRDADETSISARISAGMSEKSSFFCTSMFIRSSLIYPSLALRALVLTIYGTRRTR
jgi:hypothetical protein